MSLAAKTASPKMNIGQYLSFLARLDEVQEELLYYPGICVGVGVGVSKKFNVKIFYVMGKALSGELSCPCARSCYTFTLAQYNRDSGKKEYQMSPYFLHYSV